MEVLFVCHAEARSISRLVNRFVFYWDASFLSMTKFCFLKFDPCFLMFYQLINDTGEDHGAEDKVQCSRYPVNDQDNTVA